MANRERTKGLQGEREVAAIWQAAGFAVRGLEGSGDHLLVCADGLTLHSEVKRQEVARPWEWAKQATAETPSGVPWFVAFRRNRSPWLALTELEPLAVILAR